MRNKLYLECTSGISGDMTVAALLDLGADQKKLVRHLKSLPVKGFDIKISRVRNQGSMPVILLYYWIMIMRIMIMDMEISVWA